MPRHQPKHALKNSRAGRAWFVGGAVVAAMGIMIGAMAAIPDGNGVIHGCYNPTHGYKLRVLDTAKTANCPVGWTQLDWNQTGPPGAPGPAGVSGATVAEIRTAGEGCPSSTGWYYSGDGGTTCSTDPTIAEVISDAVFIDLANYPATATVRIDWGFNAIGQGEQVCGRLYDYTLAAPVTGSAACWTRSTAADRINPNLVPTANITLASGRHEYGIQVSTNPTDQSFGIGCCSFERAVIVIDW